MTAIVRSHLATIFKLLVLAYFVVTMASPLWSLSTAKFQYFMGEEKYIKAVIYLAIFLASCVGFALTPFVKSVWARAFLASIFMAGYFVNEILIKATGASLTPDMAGVLLANISMAPDVVPAYSGIIGVTAAVAIPCWIATVLPPRKPFEYGYFFTAVPVGALILIITTAYYSFATLIEFPSFYSVPAKFFEASLFRFYSGERRKVEYTGKINPKIKHIVLIVDESIGGDKLSINNGKVSTTPYLERNRDKFVNYGVAVSNWNCSIFSRVVLRTGLRPHQIPDYQQEALKKTTIWQYAKYAGYKTVLLDAFAEKSDCIVL